jgi:hypothetical protein
MNVSPKFNFFVAVSREELCGPFWIVEYAVTGLMYLGTPRESFMPQHQEDLAYQHDRTPPHYQTDCLGIRWFEHGGTTERPRDRLIWQRRIFFCGVYERQSLHSPPLPTKVHVLMTQIGEACAKINQEIFPNERKEAACRLDVAPTAGGTAVCITFWLAFRLVCVFNL